MEKGPKIRIIGTPEQELSAKKELLDRLFDQKNNFSETDKKFFEEELSKTETELACIDFANEETNKLMTDFGLEPYDIPPENYHKLSDEKFKEIGAPEAEGGAFYFQQGIIYNAEGPRNQAKISLARALFHETLHLKAYIAIEAKDEDDSLYRAGVSAYSPAKNTQKHRHFVGLHEAIVATAEKKAFPKMYEIPGLEDEKEWFFSEEAESLKTQSEKKYGIKRDEISWISKDGQEGHGFSYPVHRELLNYVCDEIQKGHSDKFGTKEEVFKLFLKSHFTGNLMQIAKLIEFIFGEGAFRILGNMETAEESALAHLETFKQLRKKQLKYGRSSK